LGEEVRSFIGLLISAAIAYWFFSSGLYIQVVTAAAEWYAEQVMPLPGSPSGAPGIP
jgi:hypothetical protein